MKCPNCGALIPPNPGVAPPANFNLPLISLCLGAGSLLGIFLGPVSLAAAIAAIIVGYFGWKQHRKMAAIGIALGSLCLLVYAIAVIGLFAFLNPRIEAQNEMMNDAFRSLQNAPAPASPSVGNERHEAKKVHTVKPR